MRMKLCVRVAVSALGIALVETGREPLRAQVPEAAALAGQVASVEEGPMEGVLVSAKKAGSTITTTVVTGAQGRYRFPRTRLEPGQYALRIRATGYDLARPGSAVVTAGQSATADLTLKKTTDLAAQLTNAEWIMSFPGTDQQKLAVHGCAHCHTLERIVRSRYDAEQLLAVVQRMGRYTTQSFPLKIQKQFGGQRQGNGPQTSEGQTQSAANQRRLADYLATVNLSSGSPWSYELKTFPRPKGKATRVIYTEYDLPARTHQPHDVIVDPEGFAWYASFGDAVLGKIDPKSGKVTLYDVPVPNPETVIGTNDLEFDEDGNLWLATMFQAALIRFDRKTEKFTVFNSYPPPPEGLHREFTFTSPQHSKVDGKVWANDSATWTQWRLDIATGTWEVFELFPLPRTNTYQIFSDAQNNLYVNNMGRAHIGRIDAKTGKAQLWQTPTANSGPRRGVLDEKGRLWYAGNRGNVVGMFDTRTEQFKEWVPPNPRYFPYSVAIDKNDDLWATTEFADSTLRLNTRTGEFIEYPMPRFTNGRRTWVDNKTTPVTFWVGGNHSASVVKVEALDTPPAPTSDSR